MKRPFSAIFPFVGYSFVAIGSIVAGSIDLTACSGASSEPVAAAAGAGEATPVGNAGAPSNAGTMAAGSAAVGVGGVAGSQSMAAGGGVSMAAGGSSAAGAPAAAGSDAGGAGSGGDVTAPAGTIYFSNDGMLAGWDHAKPQGNTIGRVVEVMEPAYKSATAILTEQTYVKPQGAHSEVVVDAIQRNDEDRYYGQAIYLPLDWDSIDKNATFQQFSPETPAGPWNLNWIQNDHIFMRVAGAHYDCGPIKKGAWTRVVVRFKTSNPGVFEYWVDGDKKWSVTDKNLTIPNGSPSMRWSVGIYVTWWRDQAPGAQLTRQIYHDQLRVTDSYASADPANW